MVACESCGRPIMPERQLEYEAKKAGLAEEYFRTCQACSRTKTVDTLRTAFERKQIAAGETAGPAT
jgi:RNase P subunit RPR2